MQVMIRRPDDFHVHFRQDELLKLVVPYTARWFERALVMPNRTPPILMATHCTKYEQEIRVAAKDVAPGFQPWMTIKIVQSTKPEWIRPAREVGAIAGKVYPVGVTTGAEEGVSDFAKLSPVFAAMEEVDMVLSLHGEQPGEFCTDREKFFLPTVRWLWQTFSGLRIVLEHVTTREAVQLIKASPDTVAATITAQHLCTTRDDLIGRYMQPHNFCLPEAKRPEDREALREAATSGNPKFFFGSDSAPHPVASKECAKGRPGVFTAPVAPQLLAQVFEQCGALDRLNDFTSKFGAHHYQLPLNKGTLTLVKEPMVVSERLGNVVPFMAGETLEWSVTG